MNTLYYEKVCFYVGLLKPTMYNNKADREKEKNL